MKNKNGGSRRAFLVSTVAGAAGTTGAPGGPGGGRGAGLPGAGVTGATAAAGVGRIVWAPAATAGGMPTVVSGGVGIGVPLGRGPLPPRPSPGCPRGKRGAPSAVR